MEQIRDNMGNVIAVVVQSGDTYIVYDPYGQQIGFSTPNGTYDAHGNFVSSTSDPKILVYKMASWNDYLANRVASFLKKADHGVLQMPGYDKREWYVDTSHGDKGYRLEKEEKLREAEEYADRPPEEFEQAFPPPLMRSKLQKTEAALQAEGRGYGTRGPVKVCSGKSCNARPLEGLFCDDCRAKKNEPGFETKKPEDYEAFRGRKASSDDDKPRFTDKEHRQHDHIKESEEDEGKSAEEADDIAWATVNKQKHEAALGDGPQVYDKTPQPQLDKTIPGGTLSKMPEQTPKTWKVLPGGMPGQSLGTPNMRPTQKREQPTQMPMKPNPWTQKFNEVINHPSLAKFKPHLQKLVNPAYHNEENFNKFMDHVKRLQASSTSLEERNNLQKVASLLAHMKLTYLKD